MIMGNEDIVIVENLNIKRGNRPLDLVPPCSSDGDSCNVLALVENVKQNLRQSRREFLELKKLCRKKESLQADSVVVPLSDVRRLEKETRLIQTNLPRVIISEDLLRVHSQLEAAQQELEASKQTIRQLEAEKDHWRSRCEVALGQMEQEKEDKFASQCELRASLQQSTQQSEYCAGMGAATATLLWRVSRREESIQSILAGSKVDEFLDTVAVTIQSYVETYRDELPLEESNETQFVLALCGTVTNIAASPFGRDFLISSARGRGLVDAFTSILADAPSGKCSRMKNLMLMALYNISINQKGLKHLCEKPSVIALLAWQLQEEGDVENRLNSLRLIGSLLCEQTSMKLVHEANEVLTAELLQRLASDRCPEIRESALELMTDLRTLNNQQQQQRSEQ